MFLLAKQNVKDAKNSMGREGLGSVTGRWGAEAKKVRETPGGGKVQGLHVAFSVSSTGKCGRWSVFQAYALIDQVLT